MCGTIQKLCNLHSENWEAEGSYLDYDNLSSKHECIYSEKHQFIIKGEIASDRRILMTLQELQKQALQLPISDRWQLVQNLLASLQQETSSEWKKGNLSRLRGIAKSI